MRTITMTTGEAMALRAAQAVSERLLAMAAGVAEETGEEVQILYPSRGGAPEVWKIIEKKKG